MEELEDLELNEVPRAFLKNIVPNSENPQKYEKTKIEKSSIKNINQS
jgi:hypothetical protein